MMVIMKKKQMIKGLMIVGIYLVGVFIFDQIKMKKIKTPPKLMATIGQASGLPCSEFFEESRVHAVESLYALHDRD